MRCADCILRSTDVVDALNHSVHVVLDPLADVSARAWEVAHVCSITVLRGPCRVWFGVFRTPLMPPSKWKLYPSRQHMRSAFPLDHESLVGRWWCGANVDIFAVSRYGHCCCYDVEERGLPHACRMQAGSDERDPFLCGVSEVCTGRRLTCFWLVAARAPRKVPLAVCSHGTGVAGCGGS